MEGKQPRIVPHLSQPVGHDDDDLEWVKPHRPQGLRIEDIERRSGNYILSFGMPGSGKTTFQWFLMNYLMNAGRYDTRIGVPETNDGSDWQGREIINTWKEQWIQGVLPDPTPATEDNIREVECRVVPHIGKKRELNFKFLEVAGELLRMAIPSDGNPPTLPPVIQAYLENKSMRFILFLLVNPKDQKSDILFGSFITYLDKAFPGLRNRMSLCIIVTREEDALQALREYGSTDGRHNFTEFDEEALEKFVSRFCPETHQIWDSWPDGKRTTLIAPLNIGRLEERQDRNGNMRMVLTNPNYDHIEQIFAWIYEQFNGFPMGPTFWERVKRSLSYQ